MSEQARAPGVAIVTGAAGSMGQATAQAPFDAGWADLLLCDVAQEPAGERNGSVVRHQCTPLGRAR